MPSRCAQPGALYFAPCVLSVPAQSSPHLLIPQAVLEHGPGWGREQRSESVLQDTGTPVLLQFRSLSQVATSPSLELRDSPTPSTTFEPLVNFSLPWEDTNWGPEKGEKEEEDQSPGGHVCPPVPSPIRPGLSRERASPLARR